jgi:hypothetical protein
MYDMVKPLKDGHLSIKFDSSVSSEKGRVNAAKDRVDARVDAKLPNNSPREAFFMNDWSGVWSADNKSNWNYFKNLINPKYAITDSGIWAEIGGFHIAIARIGTGSDPHVSTPDYIIYLSFNEFAITENLEATAIDKDRNEIKIVASIVERYVADVLNENCKGVIYDLRGNTGGANTDIPLLLSPLLTEDLHFAYIRTKKGVNRLSYMPWAPYIIKANPKSGGDRAVNAGAIPVVALINDYSVSCGELMPLAIKSMPHGHLVGTSTWGATGPRDGDTSPSATHDGSFTGNKLWVNVIEAGWQTKGPNFESYEGIGITPDKEIEFKWDEFYNGGNGGTDRQLEAAIDHITGFSK